MGDGEEISRFFARLSFKGERFNRSFIPVDALPAIKAYQETLLALASTIWKSDNPGKNLPRHFSERFQLGLEGIGEGSKIARLPLMDISSQGELDFDERNAFIDAQDQLAAIISDAVSTQSPFALPLSAIKPLERISKLLRPEEDIVVSPDAEGRSSASDFNINHRTIDRILKVSRHRERKVVTDVGVIIAIQESPSQVRIASTRGSFSYSIPYADLLASDALLIGSVAAFRITAEVNGVGQIVHVVSTNSLSPAIDSLHYTKLSDRLSELLRSPLELDGASKVTKSTVERAQRFSKWLARKLEQVLLSVSEEGSIQYEWLINGYACSLAISEDEFLYGVSDLTSHAFKERSFGGASPSLLMSIEDASFFLPRGDGPQ